ncbi:MAG: deoxynucleoside kinase, partial [Flavobacteriaceae bacterium]
WVENYTKGKLIVFDVDDLDFVDNSDDLGKIINRIEAEINGLF